MAKQITIKDIARKLGLSVSTISRALRNVPDINPRTKKLVLETAAELNYEPNFIAQSLITRETKMIGVIVPVISSDFFGKALTGMNEIASEQGYNLLFCQSNESADKEIVNIRQLISCRVDGLLISVSRETTDVTEFEKVLEKRVPLVFFDRAPARVAASKVIVDQYEGAFRAVEHLIEVGCTRIAHLAGPAGLSISDERMRGYRDALKKHQLHLDEQYIIRCDHFQDSAPGAIQHLLQLLPHLDGVFAVNDPLGISVTRQLKAAGVRIPSDVAVVGFNDDPVSAVCEPSLSTVMQPAYEVGKRAMEMLIHRIKDKSDLPETSVLNSRLIIRDSSRGRN